MRDQSVYIVMWCFYRLFLVSLMLGLLSCSRDMPETIGWQMLTQMQSARAGAAVSVNNGWIYISGGVDGKRYLRTVERARIRDDGSLSAFQYVRLMPEARGFHGSVVHQGYLYLAGGANGQSGGNLLNTVIRARLQLDGSLGAWESAGENMLLPRRCNKLVIQNGRLIAIGGYAGTLLDQVETGELDSHGKITRWKILSARLNVPRYINAVSYTADAIYVSGGHQAQGGAGIPNVERGRWRDGELIWEAMPGLGQGRYGLASAWLGGRLFALGGMSGARFFDQVEFWQPGSTRWQTTTRLPAAMANFASIVVNERLYLLGGVTATRYLTNVSVASLSDSEQFVAVTRQKSSVVDSPAIDLPNTGRVVEVLKASDYLYLQVMNSQGETEWLAGPPLDVEKQIYIQYSDGIVMRNFQSKSLNRQFDEIRLVSRLEKLD